MDKKEAEKEDYEIYCVVCGSRLVKSIYEVGHSDRNGEKRFSTKYSCPNKKWWNSHDVTYPHEYNGMGWY